MVCYVLYGGDVVKQQPQHPLDNYQHIAAHATKMKQPGIDIYPIGFFTTIGKNMLTEHVQLQIEMRGSDGSYSRSFTSQELWSKNV